MLKKDLMLRNPLNHLTQGMDSSGSFGGVLARAGLGKTSILVQIAMDSLLKSQNVLHISLTDPVSKICLWYEEVFRNIGKNYQLQEMDQLWDAILPHRLIMTFHQDGFEISMLEERLTELADQDIFLPQMILIDGMSLDNNRDHARSCLEELKQLAMRDGFRVWMTIRIHREDLLKSTDTFPQPFSSFEDLFETAFMIEPKDQEIILKVLKNNQAPTMLKDLTLDPTTMLVRSPSA